MIKLNTGTIIVRNTTPKWLVFADRQGGPFPLLNFCPKPVNWVNIRELLEFVDNTLERRFGFFNYD